MTRWIVLHLVHVAFGQHAALVQHGDPLGDRAHELHVVLDDDDRVLARQRQSSSAVRSVSCGVMPRPARRPAAARAPASAACRSPATASGRATACRPARRAASVRPIMSSTSSMRSRCWPAGARAAACQNDLSPGQRQLQVLEHRELLEHRRLLELAADAGLRRSRARSASAGRCSGRTTRSPASGRVLPVITSIIVVLPAPFGPMMQRSSPGSTYSVSALSALKPSKLTVRFSR